MGDLLPVCLAKQLVTVASCLMHRCEGGIDFLMRPSEGENVDLCL